MPYFITGTGTGIGKTLIAAIIAEALQADYWKPIQAGYENRTDSEWVREMLNSKCTVHPETYRLKFPASPHIAAGEEGVEISLQKICESMPDTENLVIEGAGGLMVPLNKKEFVADLIKELDATVIIVSRNCLGSINHSLLTASELKQRKIKVMGWVFNDDYLDYENEIVQWTGFPWIASVRNLETINRSVIHAQSVKMKEHLNLFI
ncbi:MAG: dethiobiotin synthase [Ginsengibacter sp.]